MASPHADQHRTVNCKPEDHDAPACGPGPFSMADANTTTGILTQAGYEAHFATALRHANLDRRQHR